MLVKLQRPPPEMRIFSPARSASSSTATRRPRLPASIAHISPAAPAPRIRASYVCTDEIIGKRNIPFPGPISAVGTHLPEKIRLHSRGLRNLLYFPS